MKSRLGLSYLDNTTHMNVLRSIYHTCTYVCHMCLVSPHVSFYTYLLFAMFTLYIFSSVVIYILLSYFLFLYRLGLTI